MRFPFTRLLVSFVASIGVVNAGLFATEMYCRYRVDSAVNQLRERGDSITPQDFVLPDLPDAENALQVAIKALEHWPRVGADHQLITETPWYAQIDYPDSSPQAPDPIVDNADYLRKCEPAFAAIEAAIAIETGRNNLIFGDPPGTWSQGDRALGELRSLARLLEDAADRAAAEQDPVGVLRMARQAWALSQFTRFKPVSILNSLVGMSLEAFATGILEKHLVSITPDAAEKALLCAALRDLLNAMANESEVSSTLMGAFAFERMVTHDGLMAAVKASDRTHFEDDPFSKRLNQFARYAPDILVRILLLRESENAIRVATAYQNALATTHWNTFDAALTDQLGPDHRRRRDSNASFSPLVRYLATAWHALARTRFQSVVRARLTRTAIALKLFELEQGRTAQRLEELLPHYLPDLPADPYDPERGPLRYRPDGVAPRFSTRFGPDEAQQKRVDPQPLAILYSVGDNHHDDDGFILLHNDGTLDNTTRLRTEYGDKGPTDHWFLLESRPLAVPDPDASEGAYFTNDFYGDEY